MFAVFLLVPGYRFNAFKVVSSGVPSVLMLAAVSVVISVVTSVVISVLNLGGNPGSRW